MDLKFKDNSQLTLPIGYMPVEYIEFSGTPNINTGYTMGLNVNVNTIVEAVIEITGNEQANSPIYIAGTSSGTNSPRFKLICNEDSYTSFKVSSKTSDSVGNQVVEFSGKTHIIQQVRKITINGNDVTLNSGTAFAFQGTFYLLTGKAQGKIWSLKVKTSETNVVRDYIPVISYQEGHFGEACLYDKINNTFYYSSSTGSFTASANLYARIITAYVKDCPNISGIELLRKTVNLQRIRCDINSVSGTLAELYKYSTYNGFNDNYENQSKPRIVGTFAVENIPYTNAEISKLSNDIDGITITPPDFDYNIDNILENDDFACQVLDSEKSNYNPAVAIALANNLGKLLEEPMIEGEGRWCLLKNVPANPGMALRGVTTITDTDKIVSDDDEAEYDFENFNEFQYFNNVTNINGGSSSSTPGAFGGCTKLKSIVFPNTVTVIGGYAFYNCTALEHISIPNSVTRIDTAAFYNCTGLSGSLTILGSITTTDSSIFYGCSNITNLIIPNSSMTNASLNNCGNGTGTLKINIIRGINNGVSCKFKNIIIYTKATGESNHQCLFGSNIYTVRLNGDFQSTSNHSNNVLLANTASNTRFVEIMGKFLGTSGGIFQNTSGLYTGCIMHLGSSEIAGATSFMRAYYTKLSKIYVGNGTSKAADEAVFTLYNADTDWSTYCGSGVPGDGKVDLWWNYNGEYKWYYVFDNLTDCTNTNPDAWPHITRGEAYETTIVPDEGYEITSCTVEMMDTDTTSPTYDTYVPQVVIYDSETGIYTIRINSVTGNVQITATATQIV